MKKSIFLYLIVCVFALVLGAYFGFLPHTKSEEVPLTTVNDPSPSDVPLSLASENEATEAVSLQVPEDRYVIRGHQGVIGVFKLYKSGMEVLSRTVDTPIHSLRQVDRDELSKGIIVHDEQSVAALLEDFVN